MGSGIGLNVFFGIGIEFWVCGLVFMFLSQWSLTTVPMILRAAVITRPIIQLYLLSI